MENRLSYSEWSDYLALIEKKARAIAFVTSSKIGVIKKIKHSGKNETSWKIGYHIVNEVTILALIEKKAKAIAFGTSSKIEVIKNN